MIRTALLASKYPSAMSMILPNEMARPRVAFVPTAGGAYAEAPWIERRRTWLRDQGFPVTDLPLERMSYADVTTELADCGVVFVEGGNTYYLLHHINRSGFFDAVRQAQLPYVGVSAGAIVLCPDIAYITDLDDAAACPRLSSTGGAGAVDFRLIPHVDDERVRPKIDRILRGWPTGTPLITLTDSEAVLVKDGQTTLVKSPKGDLAPIR